MNLDRFCMSVLCWTFVQTQSPDGGPKHNFQPTTRSIALDVMERRHREWMNGYTDWRHS